jgi:glycerol kinase
MQSKHILAIDQSTSGTKVNLVNAEGRIMIRRSKEHQQYYPAPGNVEHNPLEIYDNVKALLNEVAVSAQEKSLDIAVLSITNQRETIIVWDKQTGIPVYNAIVWQCRRTADMCAVYKDEGYETMIHAKTGLTLDPYFSATKVRWILDQVEGAQQRAEQGELLLGTIDSWLIWKLTKGQVHATDYTNASRTLLFNIHTLQWDPELLELFGIPANMLPTVHSSDDFYGETTEIKGLAPLQISGIIGDSQAALFGQKCYVPGMTKATYGTGTSLLMHTGELTLSKNGLVTSIAWGIQGKVEYALESIIHSTGDTMKWVRSLGFFSDFEEAEQLAQSLTDNEGVYLIPAFVGLGAPYWDPYARAAIVGMNRNTGRAQIIRAAMESIAYQIKDAIDLMEAETSIQLQQIKVDGGPTSNAFLMQFQADLIDAELIVSDNSELSLLGSAFLAGIAVGIWAGKEEIQTIGNPGTVFYPTMTESNRLRYHEGWRVALASIVRDIQLLPNGRS